MHDDHHDSGAHDEHAEPHEGPWTMTLPLMILGFFAIFGGIIAIAIAGGEFGGLIHASTGTADAVGVRLAEERGSFVDALVTPFTEWTAYLSLAAALIGIGLAWLWWGPEKVEANLTSDADATGMKRVWQRRYYIDQAYDRVFGAGALRFAAGEDVFDREVIDGAVNAVATVNDASSQRIRRWNTGFVQDYALTMIAGLVLIVLLVIYAPQVPGWIDSLRHLAGGS
jgi:NADH-quinone oxidoreductase subunit L